MQEYPPVGFHFAVSFQLFQSPLEAITNFDDAGQDMAKEFRFQEVSGLEVELEMESIVEGGQNRFTWQLPKRTRYSDLTLKRGMIIGSDIVNWFRDALENFNFNPANIQVALLNEKHEPLHSWYVVSAIPKKWSVSGFNAQENSIVVESLTMSYQYFNVIA
jgi:phage tail-like protein